MHISAYILISIDQGRSQKFVLGGIKVFFFGGGGIKLLNSRSDVIFTPQKVYLG